MNVWIEASRPKTLIAGISPVIIGSVIARTETFNLLTFFFTLLTAMGIQVATNFANDYFDFLKGSDTKKRLGPRRVTAAGLVKPAQMKRVLITTLIVTFCLGMYLIYVGGLAIALLLILALILAVMYTKGKYAIAYLGLGEIFVFVFFGPVATGATYYLQTGEVLSYAVLAGISPGALSTCILLINNIRDFEEDKAAKKKTIVVRYGRNFGKKLYAFLMVVGTLFPVVFFKDHPYVAISALTIFPALFPITALFKTTDFNPLLAKTAQILLLFTLIFCATWNMK